MGLEPISSDSSPGVMPVILYDTFIFQLAPSHAKSVNVC